MKQKYLIITLIVFVVLFILVLSFSVYDNISSNGDGDEAEGDKYVVEEVVEAQDVIPGEGAEIPTLEQPGGEASDSTEALTEELEETEEGAEVGGEVTIEIKNFNFHPSEVTISPGTTVTWINKEKVPHKLVAFDRVFYSPRLSSGDSYSFTFTNEGTHEYFDAVFPKTGRGTIIVEGEPLPITGGVVGVDLGKEGDWKFGLLVFLFAVMIFALSHGMYKHHNT